MCVCVIQRLQYAESEHLAADVTLGLKVKYIPGPYLWHHPYSPTWEASFLP